jgi:hypothetical protein
MPKLYVTRYYRRDRGTKFGWRLLGFDGVELARINPKWQTEKDAVEGFVRAFDGFTASNMGDLLSQAECLDV